MRDTFAQERAQLLALPENPYATEERVDVRIGKTPYARFDRNDYSVPHTHVRMTLTVMATPNQVRLLDGSEVVATHRRSYGKGQQIEDPGHIAALTEVKRQARHHRGQDRLAQAAPGSRELLTRAAERGDNLGSITASLLRLLDSYGSAELEAAIQEALQREVPHPNAVRLSLQRRREQRNQPPPLVIALPDKAQVRDLVVRPHALTGYDQLEAHSPTETPIPTAGEENTDDPV